MSNRKLYNFDWLHSEAEKIGYGSMKLNLVIHNGVIQLVEIDEVKKKLNLTDSHRIAGLVNRQQEQYDPSKDPFKPT